MITVAPLVELARTELMTALDNALGACGTDSIDLRELSLACRDIESVARIMGIKWLIPLAVGLGTGVTRHTPVSRVHDTVQALRARLVLDTAWYLEPKEPLAYDASVVLPARHSSVPPALASDQGASTLWNAFQEDAASQLAVLQDGLLGLENNTERLDLVEPVMRAAHSLKGAARVVQLTSLLSLAHSLEDAFLAVQKGSVQIETTTVTLLLEAVDLASEMARHAVITKGKTHAEHNQRAARLVAKFRDLMLNSAEAGDTAVTGGVGGAGASQSQDMSDSVVRPNQPLRERRGATGNTTEKQDEIREDRVVRVTAEMADRLLGLAGESVVEAQRIKPTSSALIELRMKQNETSDLAQSLVSSLRLEDEDPRLAILFAELAATVAECQQLVHTASELLEEHSRRATEVASRLYNDVLTSRMRPLRDRTRGLPRMARDIAGALGKRVAFSLRGDGTLVDRDILEKLEAPLGHLVRNAIDHGIETPQDRRDKGKPELANLAIEASQTRGRLRVEVRDDGRGVDVEAVRKVAITRGLLTEARAGALTREELLEFIFLPAFSTAKSVSDISGRGVGLDVVRNTVEQIGGSLRVVSQHGVGTSFVLEAPLTRSVLRCLLVRVSSEVYAVPLSRIERVLRLAPEDLRTLEGRTYVTVDEQNVVIVPTADVLGVEPRPVREGLGALVVSGDDGPCALAVDAFLGEEDLVVRPLDPRLKGVENIMAASALQDGKLVLILDVEDMLRGVDVLLSSGGRRDSERNQDGPVARRVLVVDDSLTVREAERQLLAARGYNVETAVDGADAWNALRSGSFDLVITDIDMPRMSGLELVKLIKSDESLRKVPVIIVSYKDREEDRLRGLHAGADAYIKKSAFDDQLLLDVVHDMIGDAHR